MENRPPSVDDQRLILSPELKRSLLVYGVPPTLIFAMAILRRPSTEAELVEWALISAGLILAMITQYAYTCYQERKRAEKIIEFPNQGNQQPDPTKPNKVIRFPAQHPIED